MLLTDWRLSITAIAAESRSMSPVIVGSPLKAMSELSDRSFSRLTDTPCSLRSRRMSELTFSLRSITSYTWLVRMRWASSRL